MQEGYDFKEVEPKIAHLWEKSDYTKPHGTGRPFSMYLVPPNASGPMHVGNALMVAIQDVLARYHRAKGEPTIWIPGTDHGGYETQVTFEQDLESKGQTKDDFTHAQLYDAIGSFVDRNNKTISRQVADMGGSVDWSTFRYTLDETSLNFATAMFKKMLDDQLIYRDLYMVYYCPSCATVLADIELKEVETPSPLYHIKFPFADGDGHVTLVTSRPEFLFSVTHVLAHPQDPKLSLHIGRSVINPSTGEEVQIVASKRKYDPAKEPAVPTVFMPSYSKYDFEYAIRNDIPSRNLFAWDGTMIERHQGATQMEAREREVAYLTEQGAIEGADDTFQESSFVCKKGHTVQSVLRMTWFLKLDDERSPIRKPALDAVAKEKLMVYPRWREKGLVEWLGKMHDWPIARQNVWGIRIPLWYEVTDPQLFTIWFVDASGTKRNGNLATLLAEGVSFDEIVDGLERMYAAEGASWSLEKEEGKQYLPETDTFDTWFSSGAWSAMVYDKEAAQDLSRYYPNSAVVIGHDLLRLSIAREILLAVYMTGVLPFKRVYFHQLLKAKDGQKMSKSLGNAITLDHYMHTYGADVTRMALVSYTGERGDFHMADERLDSCRSFVDRLWTMGRISDTVNTYGLGAYDATALAEDDAHMLSGVTLLQSSVGADVEKYLLSQAQEKAVAFLQRFEEFNARIQVRGDAEHAVAVFHDAFKKYLTLLHPFAPFVTESIYKEVYKGPRLLAEMVTKAQSRDKR
jgi:valyl-tRNA synthetase